MRTEADSAPDPVAGAEHGLAVRVAAVRERIDIAWHAAGRDPGLAPTLIAVTKFHPASLVTALLGLGITDMGESRHQEARAKAAAIEAAGGPQPRWHFVGSLQTNKARQLAAYASVLHSVDRIELVEALRERDPALDCFLQVNLSDDPDRGGVAPAGIEPLAERIAAAPGLRLLGIMAIAPLGEEPASAFDRLAGYAQRLQRVAPEAVAISAGMSHDFEAAIAAGATHLRIGTAITGNRPVPG